jgi:hypothetical protein
MLSIPFPYNFLQFISAFFNIARKAMRMKLMSEKYAKRSDVHGGKCEKNAFGFEKKDLMDLEVDLVLVLSLRVEMADYQVDSV